MNYAPRTKVLLLSMVLLLAFLPVGTVFGQGLNKPGPATPDFEKNSALAASKAGSSGIISSTSSLPWADALQAGGDRLTALQNTDGGWDWPLDNGNPATGSALNTLGPIGMGLARAYGETGDAGHLAALTQAGALLLTKTNNFSPSDGYLAAQLDTVFGGSTYRNHVNANFYTPLRAGTYDRNGAGTLIDTTDYVNLIRTSRATAGIGNLAAWDVGMGLVGASAAGADTPEWIAGVKAEINELDSSGYYDVIGLAGAVYGLALVGENIDPTVGEHAAASSLADLAAILAGYQISTGGFTWNANYGTPNSDEAIQETAYALLALNQFNSTTYRSQIINAAVYMRSVQLPTGGWEGYVGSGENNEITGEALWALSYEPKSVPTVVYGANTFPVNGSVIAVGPAQIIIEFSEAMKNGEIGVSAENLDNYLLVEAGVNGSFDTTSCAVPGLGAAAPDDVVFVIDRVLYNPATFIATLDINNFTPLPDGRYRLFICGTTSIESVADVELNDGLSDSLLNFTVQAGSSPAPSPAPSALPATGFPQGRITSLPAQPDAKAYAETAMMLAIPDLGVNVPIVGVPQSEAGWDVTWLGSSAGYLAGSAFPTWTGNTVITGHVWDSYNQPGPFADLKALSYGDKVEIQAWGQTYVYEVRESKLVSTKNTGAVMQSEEYDWVTLVTCEFYNPITGNYFLRRMVRAVLVEVR